ncbi:MAG TPA: sialate O-acetylesterase [Prolixibacteraceae bacterium]|nr:sialate O-acetylesterase [Prolixibacteraceae bacterium]
MKHYSGTFFLILMLLKFPSLAVIQLPALVSDHMVLQQKSTVNIWGKARPGETIEVTASWNDIRYQTTANPDSTWLIPLQTSEAGGPFTLQIKGENTITLSDILLGEVWLCSGQSNMEKPVGIQPGQKPVFNYEEEIAHANYPFLRFFHVPRKMVPDVQTDVESTWQRCTPQSIDSLKFSAAGYFFGRRLHQALDVPIGLLDATWGGTRIEAWTSVEGFKKVPSLDTINRMLESGNLSVEKHAPTLLYNGMIAPLTHFSIKGCIWYQGESNLMDVNNGLAYEDRMKALIYGWRETWQNEKLPFYYVQIAPYRYFGDRPDRVQSADELPLIWEAQTRSLAIPHTGMIVITDLVDDLSDIHPRNKQDVGLRLANLALNKTYGKKDIVCQGPLFRSMEIRKNKAILAFDSVDKGLRAKAGKQLTFFTIAGEDRIFVPARAYIRNNRVVVWNREVKKPVAVRFAWDEEAQPNLFNAAGLPAVPFRTDSW